MTALETHTPDAPPGNSALLRILHLGSPALPVGAYAYSQGLEYAIDSGALETMEDVRAWVSDALVCGLGEFELPLLARLIDAFSREDEKAVRHWNEEYLAGLDTSESVLESRQMAYSLLELTKALDWGCLSRVSGIPGDAPLVFLTVYAAVVDDARLSVEEALTTFAWSWVENQVTAAVKAIPAGQMAGQRALLAVAADIPQVVERAMALDDDGLTNVNFGLAIARCQHESMYARLFRS